MTRTAYEIQDEDKAQVYSVTTNQRQARPYPPANVRADGVLTDKIADAAAFVLSWAHRDRDIQADNLIPHTEGSTVLGEGVSYEIMLLDGGNVVRKITTREAQFSYPDAAKTDGEQFDKISLYSVKNGLKSLWGYHFSVAGVLSLLHKFDYQASWTRGDNYLNRYNDGYFGGLGYLMLSSSATASADIYNDYPLPAGQYRHFVLDYKILTYAQRRGKCRVIVQLLNAAANVVQAYESELMGDYKDEAWRVQQVSGELAQEVSTIRFKIVAQDGIANNALTFRDITIRVGG